MCVYVYIFTRIFRVRVTRLDSERSKPGSQEGIINVNAPKTNSAQRVAGLVTIFTTLAKVIDWASKYILVFTSSREYSVTLPELLIGSQFSLIVVLRPLAAGSRQ